MEFAGAILVPLDFNLSLGTRTFQNLCGRPNSISHMGAVDSESERASRDLCAATHFWSAFPTPPLVFLIDLLRALVVCRTGLCSQR